MDIISDEILELGVQALWNCKNPSSERELISELQVVGMDMKDFKTFLSVFKDVVVIDGNVYKTNMLPNISEEL